MRLAEQPRVAPSALAVLLGLAGLVHRWRGKLESDEGAECDSHLKQEDRALARQKYIREMIGRKTAERAGLAGRSSSDVYGFPSDDVVALNHRSDAHVEAPIFALALHPNHLALRADKNLRAVGDLGRQRQGDIEL